MQLAPENASAHFDLAHAWLDADAPERALHHFELVTVLAPESEYGNEAALRVEELHRLVSEAEFSPPAADLEPNRFGGVPSIETAHTGKGPLSVQMDVGAQYNSNVQLAPINRVVLTPGLAS